MHRRQYSFYPGPSQLFVDVAEAAQAAFDSGILSQNHRSSAFGEVMCQCTAALRRMLAVPPDYHIAFCTSATEAWEIIAQSLINKNKREESLHVYNGAFGEKWHHQTHQITDTAYAIPFAPDNLLPTELVVAAASAQNIGLLCLTHTETSNGTYLNNETLLTLRRLLPKKCLVAIDATASMAGIDIPWATGDFWFASVQKCFGLPAGLAVCVYSPAALQRAAECAHHAHYNNLLAIHQNMQVFQPTHTPNMLGIWLLKHRAEHADEIVAVDTLLRTRAQKLYTFLQAEGYENISKNPDTLAPTVAAVCYPAHQTTEIWQLAQQAGIALGKGYGKWKNTSFRIANFPALPDAAFDTLFAVLQQKKETKA